MLRVGNSNIVRVGAGVFMLICLVAIVVSPPLQAQGKRLALLDSLTKGEWELRFRDGSPPRKICLRSGQELVQLQHNSGNCSQVVVLDEPAEVTVQYACRGQGYGRTNIRRETRALVQLQSQGIESERPFQFYAEARRIGECR